MSFHADKSLERVTDSARPRYSRFSAVGVVVKPLMAAAEAPDEAKNSAGLLLGVSWFQ